MRIAEQRWSNTLLQLEKTLRVSMPHFSAVILLSVLGLFTLTSVGCSSQSSSLNDAQSRDLLLTQADTLYHAKRYSAAKKIYLEVIDGQQFLPITYYRLGNIFYSEKNNSRSRPYYNSKQLDTVCAARNVLVLCEPLSRWHLGFLCKRNKLIRRSLCLFLHQPL